LDFWITVASQLDENPEDALRLLVARFFPQHLAGDVTGELFFPRAAQASDIALAEHRHLVPAGPAIAVEELQVGIAALLLGAAFRYATLKN
jgi:hypothetical protein